jgi:TolB-like protein/DNA-binding winged helix-turn-helix (wHTH) protein/Flp pilus assembly protein TadD
MKNETAPKAAVPAGGPTGVLCFPGFAVDFDRGELQVGGRPVALRPKTFALLACLASHPGRLLSKDQLMAAVWPEVVVTDDSLVQCVGELRSALGPQHQGHIRTVPRRGYMLDAQPITDTAAPAFPATRPGPEPSQAASAASVPARPRYWAVPAWLAVALLLAALGLGSFGWMHRNERALEPAGLSARRTIAVLPFTDVSGDPGPTYFADGITADVIADLSRLPDTLVIAQPSTGRYAGVAPEPKQVGSDLGVRFVVAGSVLRSGQDVRIQVRLSSADTNAVLFSDTLDYNGDRSWRWRQEIGPRIAHALDIRIIDVVGGWKPDGSTGRDAIEHTMLGYSLLRRAAQPADFEGSASEFRAALRSDAGSAAAWAGLSMARSGMILMRFVPQPDAMLREAEEAAARALALNNAAPNAHYAHGQVLLLRGRLEEALAAFEESLRLSPSLTFAHARVAVILIELGRAPEALDHARTALRLSPYDASLVALAHFAAGMALFHMGQDDAAYAEMQKMVAANPRIGFAYQWMAAIDALHGRDERAREHLAQYRKLVAIQTIQGLKATERSRNPVFLAQRERFYDGLRKAGLPER